MEPVSTSGFTALLKFYGFAIVVALAASLVVAVVLMTRMPRSPQEWAVGLTVRLYQVWQVVHSLL
ncbi:hypothetical protein J532_4405 [Acinetobacter baumannii 940793]|nr:hypothetical protein J532_4405 [Acinetobacter baumannii 940793]